MRIMGTETEHAIHADSSRQAYIASNFRHHQDEIMPTGLRTSREGKMLTSGAGFYLDHELPEINTQEVWGPLGAAIVQQSGKIVIKSMVEGLRELEILKDDEYVLHNVSDGRTGWGHHINMCTNHKFMPMLTRGSGEYDPRIVAPLKMAMIGGMSLFGAGRMSIVGGFQHFQKANAIFTDIDPKTTSYRPLIAPRQEPHADPSRFYRLHIVGNDALHSPWANWLRFGVYELATSIGEVRHDIAKELEGWLPKTGHGKDNISMNQLMRKISNDPINTAFECKDGKTRTPLALLEKILEVANLLVEKGNIRTDGVYWERQLILEQLEYAIGELKNPESKDLDYLVDARGRIKIHKKLEEQKCFANYVERNAIDFLLDDVEQLAPFSKKYQALVTRFSWLKLAELYRVPVDRLDDLSNKYVLDGYPGRSERRAKVVHQYLAEEANGSVNWHQWKPNVMDKWQQDLDPTLDAQVFPWTLAA